jgi:nucleoside-diphosphate-sugar epimerase
VTVRTAVVTGGAGAIGSRLVARLVGIGVRRVVVVDDLSSGHGWLLPQHPSVRFVQMNVCDMTDVELEASEPLVFHLAAFFANQNSVDHPRDDLRTNGLGTLTALIWATRQNAQRFVYASAGCSIAGHVSEAPIHENLPVSLDLDTPYQITKMLGELYCNYFEPRLPTVRCRFFNSYGPGELPGAYRNVIPNFIWRALNGQPLVITGTGEETRDFIFVEDLATGLLAAAQTPAMRGEAVNLGSGVQTRILDLAEMVIKACRSASRIEFTSRRPWDRAIHRAADISKARNSLGFMPAISIVEGIDRTVEWFHENRQRIDAAMRTSA